MDTQSLFNIYSQQESDENNTNADEFNVFKQEVVNEVNFDYKNIVFSGLVAGITSYFMKSPEPYYQAGIMTLSQLVSNSIHNTLRDMGVISHCECSLMQPVHKTLISTLLFSVITYQSHIERHWVNLLTVGGVSSLSGNAVSHFTK